MNFLKRFGKRFQKTSTETVELSQPQSISTRLPPVYDVTSGAAPLVSGTETRTVESPQEQAHRHQKEMLSLRHKLKKDWYVTIIFTLLAGSILGSSVIICFNIQNDKNASEDLKKAVLAGTVSLWTSALSGMLGYMAGKANSGDSKS